MSQLVIKNAILLSSSVLLLSLTGCGGDAAATVDFEDREVVTTYVDNVIIPTHQSLAERAQAFAEATRQLKTAPTPSLLDEARQSWIAMRVPWEQSEAFLFGPVDAQGWDPAMDSWPLNTTDLEAVLEGPSALTAAFVKSLPDTQKGFHAAEYLLWGQDSAKTAEALTPRELEYLTALADELVDVTSQLLAAWTDGATPYRAVLVTAGSDGNIVYPSMLAAVQELVTGASGICDEVANGKIATPFDARDRNLVESQYSFNSLLDFADNMRGVQNVLEGRFGEAPAGRSVLSWLGERDAALRDELRASIEQAISSIEAIPEPFPLTILDPNNDAVIVAAQTQIRQLQVLIDGRVWTALQE